MREVREQTSVCISANEWLWGPAEVLRMIDGRGADVPCFCSHWVVTIRRFVNLTLVADHHALRMRKHTHPLPVRRGATVGGDPKNQTWV